MRYDPFQEQAIAAVDLEKSVLVSAPTGAGKTAIAEYAIVKALSRGERVIYTAPIKALSNQKYRDFSVRYPDQVGLLTGDVSLNAQAPLVIMTTEIYRNQLFEDPERLKKTSWVIFDEVHYLDDFERGTVWEEAIMFSPEHVRFLALSATAPNIEEVAEWIRSILNHPIEVIIETHRPVPLVPLFQCQGQIYSDPRALRHEGYMGQDSWPSGGGGGGGHRHGRERFNRQSYRRFLHARPNRTDDLIHHLLKEKRLPCLYFAFGRKRAEELAWEQQKFDFLRTRDYYQMAGRAGRRGMDAEGYVYARINPHYIQYPAVMKVVYGQPEAIESQFNSRYATLLNLYAQFGSKLIDIYPRSFHFYQSNKKGRQKGVAAIEKKLALLKELGHLAGEGLTPKGEFASWMYGYEILLSELLEEGYLETLDEVKLSVLLCALVFEPRKNQETRKLPPHLENIEKRAAKCLRLVHIKELANKVYPQTKSPYFHLSKALEAWIAGCQFHDLVDYTDVDEGEVIRYFRMVIQLLRQLKQAPQVSERLRQTAKSAQNKINRDLVDAEKQLRNM